MKMIRSSIAIIMIFCAAVNSWAQASASLDVAQKQSIDSILKLKPKDYPSLNSSLKVVKNDSIEMSYFLDVSIAKNYVLGESMALNNLGIYCRNTSQYKAAIAFHEQALIKARKAKSQELQIISLNMLGVVYRRIDAIKTALDYHYQAISMAESIPVPNESIHRSIAVSLNSMGNIYMALNQYDLAIEKFNKSLGIESSLNNKLGLAINYHNIGFAQESLGLLDKALENYRISLGYNNEIHSALGQVICNNSIAKVFIEQEKYQQATALIMSSLKKAKSLRDRFHLVGLYNNLGLIYLKLGNMEASKNYLEEALKVSRQHNFKSAMANSYKYLSEHAEQLGHHKEALAYYKDARLYEEEVQNEKNFQYVNDLIVKYKTENITNQVQVLSKENEAAKDKFRRNRSIWLVSIVLLGFLIVLTYALNRQHILNKEKKILTLEQKMLRSQMNPHFVFNSLNSIKHYIISNDIESAVHYLNKFSKLIRKILELSMAKEVTLAEEIETMKLYMSIENIRFSNDIDFTVDVEDDLDTQAIKIPSLVLQPFLENSLWHGLSSKKGDKKINLTVSKPESSFVQIVITDNGIGRVEAAKIRQNKSLKRKSVGITLTKDRLTNYAQKLNHRFRLDFKDLMTDGVAAGTQVVLSIPLN